MARREPESGAATKAPKRSATARVARATGRVLWGSVKVAGRVLWWTGKTSYRLGAKMAQRKRATHEEATQRQGPRRG